MARCPQIVVPDVAEDAPLGGELEVVAGTGFGHVPGGIDQLRAALLDAVSDDIWESARNGFGDPDLADQ